MNGFLAQVAGDLYGRYGDGVSSLSMVFPSHRASLFFGEALSEIITRPLWQPRSLTIDAIAEELSGLAAGGRLRLVAELYRVYAEFHPAESFDTFYFWGELLLGDFDAIDKYLIDADALFSNLVDLHELDGRFDYLADLSEEQRAVIEKFWGAISLDSPEQKDFMKVWRTLGPVYHRFRERLLELGIAYQGMVYREAAERIMNGNVPVIPERHYVVAGFNALSRCEQVIFDYLRGRFEVDFYWDYDNYYTGDGSLAGAQEAGRFMRDNLSRFPPVATLSSGYDNFAKPKRIRSVAAGSDVLQCKYAGLRLGEIARQQGTETCGKAAENGTAGVGKETAVVLCNEGLLVPLLWSMPPEVEKINITMGYPLRMHPAYTFVERLVELQNRRRVGPSSLAFYHSDVEGLLGHPYLTGRGGGDGGDGSRAGTGAFARSKYVYINAARLRTTPVFEKIFTAPEGWRGLSDWLVEILGEVGQGEFGRDRVRQNENGWDGTGRGKAGQIEAGGKADVQFFAIITDHILTLANSLDSCGVEMSTKTYASLLRRSLQSVTVPFEGEPLEGVQVMGILETRALDFENIIFLSAGDDNLPGNLVGAPSFIPYSLKMAFGLPTPEHHEGVYAYHFFRLIQRAGRVDMVWSSTADDRSAGEVSRYVLQLDYESQHTIEKESITVDVNLSPVEPVAVEKSEEVMEKLGEFLVVGEAGVTVGAGEGVTGEVKIEPGRKLSPSLFYSYVECPLKFYFRAVARLRVDDEVSEEVDNAMFGSILHLAMQLLYAPLTGVAGPQKQIGALIGSAEVERVVSQAAREHYTREEGSVSGSDSVPKDWSGSMLLACNTIVDYINRSIMPFDAGRQEAYTIERLEEWVEGRVFFNVGGDGEMGGSCGATKAVCFHGKVDRIDKLEDGTLQVIDYKTGNPKNNMSALLQTGLYAMMLERSGMAPKVRPVLYYVRDMSQPNGVSGDNGAGGGRQGGGRSNGGDSYTDNPADFEENLRVTLGELFDPAVPFTQCPDPKPCEWCDFNTICRR